MKRPSQVKLQPSRRRMRQEKMAVGQLAIPRKIASTVVANDADQDRAADLARHQNQHDGKADTRKLRFVVREAAQSYERRLIRDHQLRIAQARRTQ